MKTPVENPSSILLKNQSVLRVLMSWWLLFRSLLRSCCWDWLRSWFGSFWSPFTTVMNLPSLKRRKPGLSGKRLIIRSTKEPPAHSKTWHIVAVKNDTISASVRHNY